MKGIFKKARYVLPLLGVVALLLFLDFTLKDSREKFESRLMIEEIHWVSDMTARMAAEESAHGDSLINAMTRNYIITMIENRDKEKGIFACVTDTDFNLVSERYTEQEHFAVEKISIPEPDRARMKLEKTGFVRMIIGEMKMNTFFAAYPKDNTVYYIFIGVSPYVFNDIFNVNRITLTLLVLMMVMLVFVYTGIINN